MRYKLATEKSINKNDFVDFLRIGSGTDSFMCQVTTPFEKLNKLIHNIKNDIGEIDLSEFSYLDKLITKYLWRIKEIKKVGTFTGVTPKTYIIFYTVVNKNNENFIFIKSRNHSPYYEQSCAFSLSSVLETLQSLVILNKTQS